MLLKMRKIFGLSGQNAQVEKVWGRKSRSSGLFQVYVENDFSNYALFANLPCQLLLMYLTKYYTISKMSLA